MVNGINNKHGIAHQAPPMQTEPTQLASTRFTQRNINVIPNHEADLSKAQSTLDLHYLLHQSFPNHSPKHISALLTPTTDNQPVESLRQKTIKIV
ncbi:hypothetical protein HQQ94_00440 [Shewanella sp. VB17]|uniref:hypothetical protein n=1 Tax=Shewanella sp. VB17 TaxID=2739432 RepID=UPI001567A6CD|nr:hypothetical protein [Shewanella sp. VB17]NRD71743.1 hypothetical protein [Shewanella sp. VB17]